MYNQEILEKIVVKFGTQKAIDFCEIATLMYDIKYNACKEDACKAEYDYERDWWEEAAISLKQQQLCSTKNS